MDGYKSQPLQFNYKFFEDYNTNNVIEILEKEKPDVILSSNDYEFFGRSIILAAKFKKIPTVLLLHQLGFNVSRRDRSVIQGRFTALKERRKYLLEKYRLLLTTYKKIGFGIGKIVKLIINDIIAPFLDFEPAGKYGCDLILVTDKNSMGFLEKRGIKSKIVVTGDPEIDTLYKRISEFKTKSASLKSPMKFVLITTGMVEHGVWNKRMWEETIQQTVKKICTEFVNEIELVIKIHPTTEHVEDYSTLLQKIGYSVPILQTEDLTSVINNADVVISYGDSWAIWQAILLKKPVIIVNLFDYQLQMPFVKEGVAFELKKIHELRDLILKIKTEKIDDGNIEKLVTKYLFKFDGKASERSALAIIQLVRDNKLQKGINHL